MNGTGERVPVVEAADRARAVRDWKAGTLSHGHEYAYTLTWGPHWMLGGKEHTFMAAVEKYVAWMTAHHGRKASRYSKDPDEKRNGGWMEKQRTDKAMDQTRRQILNEKIPGWDDVVFAAALESYVSWVTEHGRKPSSYSKDPDEKRNGGWMEKQRMGRGMTPERRQILGEKITGWNDPLRPGRRRATAKP